MEILSVLPESTVDERRAAVSSGRFEPRPPQHDDYFRRVCERRRQALVRNEALLRDVRQVRNRTRTALASVDTSRLKILKQEFEASLAALHPQLLSQSKPHTNQPPVVSTKSSNQLHSRAGTITTTNTCTVPTVTSLDASKPCSLGNHDSSLNCNSFTPVPLLGTSLPYPPPSSSLSSVTAPSHLATLHASFQHSSFNTRPIMHTSIVNGTPAPQKSLDSKYVAPRPPYYLPSLSYPPILADLVPKHPISVSQQYNSLISSSTFSTSASSASSSSISTSLYLHPTSTSTTTTSSSTTTTTSPSTFITSSFPTSTTTYSTTTITTSTTTITTFSSSQPHTHQLSHQRHLLTSLEQMISQPSKIPLPQSRGNTKPPSSSNIARRKESLFESFPAPPIIVAHCGGSTKPPFFTSIAEKKTNQPGSSAVPVTTQSGTASTIANSASPNIPLSTPATTPLVAHLATPTSTSETVPFPQHMSIPNSVSCVSSVEHVLLSTLSLSQASPPAHTQHNNVLILSQNHSDLSLSLSETPVQLSVEGEGGGEETGSLVESSEEDAHLNDGSMHSQTEDSLSNGSQVSSKASQIEDSHSNCNKVGCKDKIVLLTGSSVDGKGEDNLSMNTLSHSDAINTSDYNNLLVENHSVSHVQDVVREIPSLTGPIPPLSSAHMDEERGGRKEEEEVKKKEKNKKREEKEEEETKEVMEEAEEGEKAKEMQQEKGVEETEEEEENEDQEREMQVEAASNEKKRQKLSLLSSSPLDEDAYSSFLQSVRQSSAIETLSVSELDELEDEVQGRGSTPAPLPPPAVSVAGGVDESESGKGQEVVAIGREEKSREGNMLRLSARSIASSSKLPLTSKKEEDEEEKVENEETLDSSSSSTVTLSPLMATSAYVPTALETRQPSSKSDVLKKRLGFWGSEESLDGSDPQLTMSPAATLTEEDNEDFYF